MSIAVLGTGLMGAAITRRLCAQGVAVRVWNRTPERAQALEAAGARSCASARQAVQEADCVLLMLSDAVAIDEVLAGAGVPEALGGRVLVQMGTIGPAQSRALAAKMAGLGADYVEAPVLGSIPEASKGELLIMVGGEDGAVRRARGVLERLGPAPRHVGPVGHAAALKLAFNQLIASLTAGFALSLGLVRREGAAVDAFMQILRDSALYAPTFDKKLERELERRFDAPNFPLKHLLKDVDLFLAAARDDGLDPSGLEGVRELLVQGMDAGFGELDYSALYAVIDPE